MTGPPRWVEAELEGLDLLEAVRRILDAILAGEWLGDPVVVANLAETLHRAERQFTVARDLAGTP